MFARRPGTLRPEDLDGEEDKPITPIAKQQELMDERGEPVTDQNGDPILI